MTKEELHNFIKNPLTSSQITGNTKYEAQKFDNGVHCQTIAEIEAEEQFYNSEWTVFPPLKEKE